MLGLVEHFKGVPVTNDVLLEYCNLNHIVPAITVGAYQDFLYQYNYDVRVGAIVPKILEALSKYQHVPLLISDAERVAMGEANEAISIEICRLMEEGGILYQDIDLLTGNFGSELKAVMDEAGRRANNMASTMLAHTAKEKYGDPLTVKVLGEAYRTIAKEKGVKKGLL